MDWTLSPNDNYDDLAELYGEMVGVYRRYIYHVHSMIGEYIKPDTTPIKTPQLHTRMSNVINN